MPAFDLLEQEFGGREDFSVAPYWLVVAWPFRQHLTFNRAKLQGRNIGDHSISVNNDVSETAQALGPVFMYQDCISLQTSGNKESYVANMQAAFKESGRQYLTKVFPGDHCAAWIVYGDDKLQALIQRIKDGQPCNRFEDGLKFVGKVRSFRKAMVMNDGVKTKGVRLNAAMFTEFSSQLFYDPQLRQTSIQFGDVVGKLNIAINELMSMDRNVGIDSNKIIPIAIDLLVGSGAPASFADPSGELAVAAGPVQQKDQPPAAYVMPEQIGKVLGARASASPTGLFSYADILNVNIGIQKYDDSLKDYKMFAPRGADNNSNRNIFAKNDSSLALLGSFLPLPLSFTNKALWSLMTEFLNPVMNDMFTALRVNHSGNVMPTLVVRQHPLTSDGFFTLPSIPVVTRFLEVPRWKASDAMIRTYDVGRSDEVGHFNFFHVYGAPVTSQPNTALYSQIARNPPLSDDQDFRRNGILPYMTTVNCSTADAAGDAAAVWAQAAADFHLGSQFMFNGSVGIQGTTFPICHGDNFEFESTVYQIESVSHSCELHSDGKKSFVTYLALSHGVESEVPRPGTPAEMQWFKSDPLTARGEDGMEMYPDIDPVTDSSHDPGLTGDFALSDSEE